MNRAMSRLTCCKQRRVNPGHHTEFGKLGVEQCEILPILKERGVGAIGMKSLAGGELLKTNIPAGDAIRYSLSLPIDSLVSGMDSVDILNKNLEIVRDWTPLGEEEKQRFLQDAVPFAADGQLERYKSG